MKQGTITTLVFASLICAGFGSQAKAALAEIRYTGHISEVSTTALGLQVGDTFQGRFVYDDAATDTDSRPTYGNYITAPSSVQLQIGGINILSDIGCSIFVANNRPDGADILGVRLSSIFTNDEYEIMNIGFALKDSSGTAFSSDALPKQFPPVSAFDPYVPSDDVFMFEGTRLSDNRGFGIFGGIDSITPEPATMLLFAAGAALIRRRTPAI